MKRRLEQAEGAVGGQLGVNTTKSKAAIGGTGVRMQSIFICSIVTTGSYSAMAYFGSGLLVSHNKSSEQNIYFATVLSVLSCRSSCLALALCS